MSNIPPNDSSGKEEEYKNQFDNLSEATQNGSYIHELENIDGKRLTKREIDILACIMSGKSSKTIAQLLSISWRTVDNHVYNLINKMQCHSRDALISFFEKTNKMDLLKQHYQNLLIHNRNNNHHFINIEKNNIDYINKEIVFKLIGFILFFSLLFLFFNHYRNNFFDVSHYKDAVRADLLIPGESSFLGRPNLIRNLKNCFKHGNNNTPTIKVVGLVGVGGSGKTTLARLYAKSSNYPIIWEINAENQESIISSFYDLAYALAKTKEELIEIQQIKAILYVDQRNKMLVEFVKSRLRKTPNWLLIYDNLTSFSETKTFFPHDVNIWGKGSVIVTTRDSNILSSTYIDKDNVIQVDQLSEDEALNLFCKILYHTETPNLSSIERNKLVTFLSNIPLFPLDILLSAYYIKNNEITPDQYLEHINKHNKIFNDAQKEFIKEISDYKQTRYDIITLSIKKILKINNKYKYLLFIIYNLNSQNIPINLISFGVDPVLFEQFVYHLKKYSLISSANVTKNKNNTGSFDLHRIIQNIGREFLLELLKSEEKEEMMASMVVLLSNFYNEHIKNNYQQALILVPHLDTFLKNIKKIDIPMPERNKYEDKLNYLLGYSFLQSMPNLIKAKEYLEEIYKLSGREKNKDINKIALLLSDLAEICVDLEFSEEAIKYANESILLGDKTPNKNILRANNLSKIGYAYTNLNNFEKAEKSFTDALRILSNMKSELRKETESTVYSMLGWLYSVTYINRNNALKGVELAQHALEILNGTQFYEQNNISQAQKISCNIARHKVTLGDIYCRLGNYKEAKKYFDDATYIINNEMDTCAHHLLKAYIKIGQSEIFLREKDFLNAEIFLNEAIRDCALLTNKNNTLTLVTRVFYVESLLQLGKLDLAEKECEYIFQITDHSQTNYAQLMSAISYYHAANIQNKKKMYNESFNYLSKFFQKISSLCKEILSPELYQTLATNGQFNVDNKKSPQAGINLKILFNNAKKIFIAIYGKEHPFIKDYINNV